MANYKKSHDLRIPAWGPYSKTYHGVSHIPESDSGKRFDISIIPGIFRRKPDVPNVRFEGDYSAWKAAGDLSCYTFRYQLEWKDKVYADVSCFPLDKDAVAIRTELVNHSQSPQNLVLHYLASLENPGFPNRAKAYEQIQVSYPQGAVLFRAIEYSDLVFHETRHTDALTWDGLLQGEEGVDGFYRGYGLGQGFGAASFRTHFCPKVYQGKGDKVTFKIEVPQKLAKPVLLIRYQNDASDAGRYLLNGTREVLLPPANKPEIVRIALDHAIEAGSFCMELLSYGEGNGKLDCFVLCEEDEQNDVQITHVSGKNIPKMSICEADKALDLDYDGRAFYSIRWDFPTVRVREIEDDNLDVFMRDTVHNHVSNRLVGNGRKHYADVFVGPILLEAGASKVLYATVCYADSLQELEACKNPTYGPEQKWEEAAARMEDRPTLPAGNRYKFGQQLMKAVLSTNVVYPVYTQGQHIRHNTPGKWWDCLYTWDSGFTGIGLATFDVQRAKDCLLAYLTEKGNPHAAFIHHGSLVPVQYYLLHEILNKDMDLSFAAAVYPMMQQYYDFYMGKSRGSTTANLASGLLRPWDYFYNSGGWDDYPAQVEVHRTRSTEHITPVVTSAHGIRIATFMAQLANLLQQVENESVYQTDRQNLQNALEQYSWDEGSGYFSYVVHDELGRATGCLNLKGTNANKGLDGVSPLFGGACLPQVAARLWQQVESSEALWSPCGISTVDQSAPYYKPDGYWNGAVWMPYQYFLFKSALDYGKSDFAWKIAETALDLWAAETGESYKTFEHFMLQSRRGAGWHQFGGLSAPVAVWFTAYFVPETVTTGFDTLVLQKEFSDDGTLRLLLHCQTTRMKSILVAMPTFFAQITVEGVTVVETKKRHEGLWEILFVHEEAGEQHLVIKGS